MRVWSVICCALISVILVSNCSAAYDNHNECDCFAAAILSHGDGDNQIYGVDGKTVGINRLTDPIKDCLALAGKPKIFFFEVGIRCQHLYLLWCASSVFKFVCIQILLSGFTLLKFCGMSRLTVVCNIWCVYWNLI
jgi:hypothetical protein